MKIGLVQINNSFSGQSYLPYSAALLQSYAKKNYSEPSDIYFADIIYKRLPVKDGADKLKDCDLIGFSTYVWNIQLSLRIAEEVKRLNPNCIIVLGGPQVPDEDEEFLKANRYIDLCVHGEGELVFCELLENVKNGKVRETHSISYLDGDEYKINPRLPRLRDLNDAPSPYLNGEFDSLIQKNVEEKWIGLWETNRGCPFSCTFCDWGSAIASKVNQFSMERLKGEVDWFANNKIEYIFCCDANYGILPRDLDITQMMVDVKRSTGYPQGFSVQCTKNATERAYQSQKLISDAGMQRGVDIALQSVDPQTLKNIKRANISVKTYEELQKRFVKDKIETYTDLILALPGETYDSFLNGIDAVINMGQHNRIQFNNLSILPNAEVGNKQYQKDFGIEYIESNIVNPHGRLDDSEVFVQEKQQIVTATNSMPKEDWLKVRAYCWMVALLHFNKVLQIPIIVTKELTSLKYREIFDAFMDEERIKNFPAIQKIRNSFIEKAKDIQNGGEEYHKSVDWLNIWWYEDEYAFISLIFHNQLDDFYKEAKVVLEDLLKEKSMELPNGLLDDCIKLNNWLITRPFMEGEDSIEVGYNIYHFYRAMREGNKIPMLNQKTTYRINRKLYKTWDEWFTEVVWYGNKKGIYIHSIEV